MPRSTPDHEIETALTGLLLCPTLRPIQVHSSIPISVLSRAQTSTDGQVTNLPPLAMPGIQGRGGRRSRGHRGNCREQGGRDGGNTRGGREVQEKTALAILTVANLPNNNNDLNPTPSNLNDEDSEAERPRRQPRN